MQILYPFPAGISYFEKDVVMVKTSLNSCDPNFPLGIIDCDITYTDPNRILPNIAIVSDNGNLTQKTEEQPEQL